MSSIVAVRFLRQTV